MRREFAGFIESQSSAYAGLRAPAKLTLMDRGEQYECQFEFELMGTLSYVVFAPKVPGDRIAGTTRDPRGWDVSFTGELNGQHVIGTFDQPHDRGTFELREIETE